MADNEIKHPEGDYTIQQVGPSREWDFSGQGGKVVMKTYSVQLEGIADWVDLNQKADTDAPTVGEIVKGHVEDAGKYGLKFVKAKKAGSWSGGGKSSPGAIWSAAYSTAVDIVNGFYQASGSKPKDFEEFLSKIDAVAPIVRQKVDALAGTSTEKKEESVDTEAGESPVKDNGVVTTDVSDKELGKW